MTSKEIAEGLRVGAREILAIADDLDPPPKVMRKRRHKRTSKKTPDLMSILPSGNEYSRTDVSPTVRVK